MTERVPDIQFVGSGSTRPAVVRLNRAFRRWRDAIEWCRNLNVQAPLTLKETPTGPVIGIALEPRKLVKLTSAATTAGSYNATEVYASSSGGWVPVPGGWSGVAWEYNLYAGLTLPAVVAADWCGASSDWRFQLGGCS